MSRTRPIFYSVAAKISHGSIGPIGKIGNQNTGKNRVGESEGMEEREFSNE
jgi:hypothetical protein